MQEFLASHPDPRRSAQLENLQKLVHAVSPRTVI